jgi:phage-related protein
MKKLIVFDERAQKELNDLDSEIKRLFLGLAKQLGLQGELREPDAKKLSGYRNLYELRVRFKGQWRAFYAYIVEDRIVILSIFRKKTQKTPSKEIDKVL